VSESFTVLTVCTGNLHRSALAADLLATWARWYLPGGLYSTVVVGSAGTRAPIGAPMGRETRLFASGLGADDRGHRARLLADTLITDADLVLAASRAHRDEIVTRVPRAMRRTFSIREAGRIAALVPVRPAASVSDLVAVVGLWADGRAEAAAVDRGDDDIIDPQGRGAEAADEMVRQEVPPLVAMAVALWGMPRADADAYLKAAANPPALR